jgi:hypothetical protein
MVKSRARGRCRDAEQRVPEVEAEGLSSTAARQPLEQFETNAVAECPRASMHSITSHFWLPCPVVSHEFTASYRKCVRGGVILGQRSGSTDLRPAKKLALLVSQRGQ